VLLDVLGSNIRKEIDHAKDIQFELGICVSLLKFKYFNRDAR
jgi:hypothetical protein